MANRYYKAIFVGLIFLTIDAIVHQCYFSFACGNEETLSYFFAKPFIAGAVAFLGLSNNYLSRKINSYFRIRKKQGIYSAVIYGTIFSLIHGLYYRIWEIYSGKELFSRVGEVTLNGFTLSTLPEMVLAWWIIHGIGFALAFFLINKIMRK